MKFSMPAHNPRLAHLTHALAAAHRATNTTARRRAFALASRHARGQDVYLAPGEERCPYTGQPRTPTAEGETIRALIDALRASGTRITIPLLEECHQARVDLRVRRAAGRPSWVPPLDMRLHDHLVRRTREAVEERGLPTPTEWEWPLAQVVDYDPARRLWLVRAEYRYEDSQRAGPGWHGKAYVSGVKDDRVWVERVDRPTNSVEVALAALTPAAEHRAREEGRRV
ncbi:hypothetical protein [Deinococcus apachensis]|uniref:hypothetical protein n=1 Tax=Deinococcus apachensis TaxID=309886 RepID=UPI00039D01B4|nr:hypothetical protein [Deinococcus apachensis]